MNKKDKFNKIILFIDTLLEQSTPEKPAWNLESIIDNKPAHWNYIDGCMIKAILDIYDATGNKKYLDFTDRFIDFFIDDDGKILGYNCSDYNCDNINEGKVLYRLYEYTGKRKYFLAIDTLYYQLKNQPRTESGNFWHKKIYPNQTWLDGLYMVQPFYMAYEMKFNAKVNYRDIIKQFENVHRLMRDEKTGLFYHGYDGSRESFWCDKKTGLSSNFWTRSIGWYIMALVDTLEEMDDMFFQEYMKLQDYLKEIVDAVLIYKDKEKNMFWQVTDQGARHGNYLETSGSSAICYGLLKASRLGFLPAYYARYGVEIFNSITDNKLELKDDEFILKDICLVAGLGGMPGKGSYKLRDGSYEYYISEPKVNNDAKGVAPYLFSFAEIIRLDK